jgi:hypothetical protein
MPPASIAPDADLGGLRRARLDAGDAVEGHVPDTDDVVADAQACGAFLATRRLAEKFCNVI